MTITAAPSSHTAAASKSQRTHHRRWLLVLLVALLVFSFTGEVHPPSTVQSLPVLGGGGTELSEAAADGFIINIPSIELQVPVIEAHIRGESWDFSQITHQAAHLQLTAYPGQGTNVVVGAHYELADFAPGPFYRLDRLEVGDQVQVQFQGAVYLYTVNETLLVDPGNIAVALRTPQETLTLLTCYSYNRSTGHYAQRYVVRASLVTGS